MSGAPKGNGAPCEERAEESKPKQTEHTTPSRPVWPKESAAVVASMSEFPLREFMPTSPDPVQPFEKIQRPEYYFRPLLSNSDIVRVFGPSGVRADSLKTLWRSMSQYSQMLASPLPTRLAHSLPEKRRFLVIRFDGSLDNQAKRVQFLKEKEILPLTLVVFDGYRGLESWWLAEWEDERAKKLFALACSIGADQKTWALNFPARIPDGRRDISSSRDAWLALRKAGLKEICGTEGLYAHAQKRQLVVWFDPTRRTLR